MTCYHFISKKNLSRIKKDGVLKPNTRLFLIKNIDRMHKKYGLTDKDYNDVKNLVQKLPKDKFTCVIPKKYLKSWGNSGLLDEIKYFIKPHYVLEFEIPPKCKMFVREHFYQSPKYIKKIFRKNRYSQILESDKTNIWVQYFKSTKSIKDEADFKNIRVPELWIGCPIKNYKLIKL
ncbi:MAG: hypothetical protein Q8R26_03850 [bacterium]|nr:hypothetical protein [bacterium]